MPRKTARRLCSVVVALGSVQCVVAGGEARSLSRSQVVHFNGVELIAERRMTALLEGASYRSLAVGRSFFAVLLRASDTLILLRSRADAGQDWLVVRTSEREGLRGGFWSIVAMPGEDSQFVAFDVRRGAAVRVEVQPSGIVRSRVVQLRSDAALLNAAPLRSAKSFVARGLFQRALIAVFDSMGGLGELLGAPPPAVDSVPIVVRQHAYQGKVTASSSEAHFAVSGLRSSSITILLRDGGVAASAGAGASFAPSYVWRTVRGQPMASFLANSPMGYVDVVSDDSVLIGLFSGDVNQRSTELPTGGELHRFNWNGQCLSRHRIEGAGITAIGASGGRIFGLGNGLAPEVVEFVVDESSQGACAATPPLSSGVVPR
jgi:hypothetical protein